MADTKLGVIIEAEDRATEKIRGVQSSLGGLKGAVDNMQPAFRTMAAVGTVAFGAISGAVYTSLQAADEATKVQAQLNAVLKSTGGVAGVTADAVNKLSKELQKQTTFGDEAITSAQNMLLTFTNVGKDVFPDATKAVLDMSVALGQDLKSSSIQLGKALNDPILGVTALRKVGVNFSEAQQEMIKGMVESGQLMEAQKFILKELATEFGGSASAQAETFGGRIQQAKERIGDLQEAIGTALIPVITSLTEKVAPVIEKMVAWAEANPQLVTTIVFTASAVAGLVAVVGLLGMALPAIIAGFSILASPITLVVIALAALVGVMVFYRDRITEVIALIDQKTGLITLMKDAWDNVVETFTTYLLPALQELWASLEPLKPFLEALGKVIGTMLVIAIGGLVMAVEGWIQIFTLLLTVGTKIATFFSDVFVKSINFVIDTVAKAITYIENLINAISRLNVLQSAKNFIGNAVGAAKGVLGINDGIVQNGKIITTHPDDYIVATKNPAMLGGGGSVVVNINGGNFLSESAGLMLGDQIIEVLRRNMRV